MADQKESSPTCSPGVTASGLHYDDNGVGSCGHATGSRDDEKSHTFRQRRLTYTRHHLQGSASAAAAALVADGIDLSDEDDQEKKPTEGEASHAGQEGFDEAATDIKSDKDAEAADAGDADAPEDSPSEIRAPSLKKPRLEPRVLHATAPPHHMRREAKHRLYEHQNSECAAHKQAETEHAVHVEEMEMAERTATAELIEGGSISGPEADHSGALVPTTALSAKKKELPAWRRRRFIRHSIKEDESLLPFPRDIVGTYSCHGVEPLYDSDYDHDEDDDGNGQSRADAEDSDDDVKGAARTAGDNTVAKINQDRGGVAFPYGNCPRTALFAAYDGHGDGGEYVAQYALHEVQRRLEQHPTFDTDITKAFHDTFVGVDEDLQTIPEIEALYAGATACVVLLRERTLTIANAGDSRAVLARRRRGSGKNQRLAMDLSVDHNPDSVGEQERIEKAGGFVSPPPEPGLSARVWLDPEVSPMPSGMTIRYTVNILELQ